MSRDKYEDGPEIGAYDDGFKAGVANEPPAEVRDRNKVPLAPTDPIYVAWHEGYTDGQAEYNASK